MTARCLAGSALILVIALLRLALRRHLPRGTFLVLWYVALARLLLPVTWPSALSVYSLLSRPAPAVSAPVATHPAMPAALPTLPASPAAAPAAAVSVSPWTVVWVVGSALLALWFLTAYLRCRRRFAAATPVEDPAFAAWLEAHPLRRRLSIRYTKQVDAPLTYGLLRPVILLPAGTAWGDGMALVLAHELVHIRRFDGLAKLAMAAALCLYWWSPAVWLLYILAGRDLELSCDEAVLRAAPSDIRRRYAEALLSMEAQKSGLAPALHSRFGGCALRERIVSIMKYKKTTVFAVVLAAALVAGVTTALATSPRAADPRAETESAPAAQSFTYAPVWMQPGTEIVYNDDLSYTILEGGELTEADIAGREDIAAVGLTSDAEEMRVWPGCKAEYDLHGFIENIYFPVPGHPGEFQLEDPDREAHRAQAEPAAAVTDAESQPSQLLAVRRDDEANYAPEEWAEILRQVEQGEVQFFDTREQELAYARLISFETPDYRFRTVAGFNADLVPDRDALGRRLEDYTLVRDAGAQDDFLNGPLWQSLSECYGDYMEPSEPYFRYVTASQPAEDDFFASATFRIDYTLPDPDAVTVGDRYDALEAARSALEDYFGALGRDGFSDSGLPQRMQTWCDAYAAEAQPDAIPMTITLDRLEGSVGGQEFLYEGTESAIYVK